MMCFNQFKSGERGLAPWIRTFLLAWLMAATVEYFVLPTDLRGLDGLLAPAAMSLGRVLALTLGLGALLLIAQRFLNLQKVMRWMMAAVFGMLAGMSLTVSFTWAFLAACIGVMLVLVVYATTGWNGEKPGRKTPRMESPVYPVAAGVAALAFFLFVSVWTVGRVYSFSTPTFDFGIFAQMFHSMRTTLEPITTVERDGALSHFAVHMSPIYYLMLPFYCLVPKPATLQVLQAAVLASAVIPMWKLGKHHGLTGLQRLLVCLVLLVYPAYAGGTSYDIHENAFLTPLILCLLYGIDRRNGIITAVFTLLTLMVKEDAAVYVAVVALYVLLRAGLTHRKKWDLIAGGVMLVFSLAWFAAVTGYLATSGDGVMTYRYKNFMYDGSSSLVTVVKAVLLCPMKAVFECMDAEKLKFLALTMLPLAWIPLLTRRYERYLLLIPYLLVNLMSDYQYQHDIFFQYTYGSTACLMYLLVVNLADLHWKKERIIAAGLAVCIGAACFGAQIVPKGTKYPGYCVKYGAYYDSLRKTLDVIPEGASVAATTFYTTYLSQRDVLYDIRYCSREHLLDCEYMAVGVTDSGCLKKFASGDKSGYEGLIEVLQYEGYQKIAEYQGKLEIYQRVQ